MTRNYYVYLSNEEDDPEDGTEHTDWVSFICKTVEVGFTNNNDVQEIPDHESFEIKLGEIKFKVRLSECIFMRLDISSGGETSWNDFVKFIGAHAMSGGDTFYLRVYEQLGSDSAATYMEFFDDSGDMQDYMRCRVKSFKGKLDATKKTIIGSLEIEEVWS